MADIFWLVFEFILGTSFVLLILYLGFMHIEKLVMILTWICRFFSWANRTWKQKTVAAGIQSQINIFAEAIESEVQGVMPHPMRIKWITSGEELAHLKEGQIVVRLRNEFNDARNIVTATMLYIAEGLLRDSRPYIDGTLIKALDLTIAWKTLEQVRKSEVTHHFLTNFFNPSLEDDEALQEDCEMMSDLEVSGLLTRILMREMRILGTKATALRESRTIALKTETRSFSNFIHTIATSERGSKHPLDFVGNKIRVGILLVARMETLAKSGLRAHENWFRRKRRMGVETIYVLAIGDANVHRAKRLARWAQAESIAEIVRHQKYTVPSKLGKLLDTIVITCHSTMAKADAFLDRDEEVHAVLARHIPEIARGGG